MALSGKLATLLAVWMALDLELMMNENRDASRDKEFDTADVIEAVMIAAVSYATWRDYNHEIDVTQPGRPHWLQHMSGTKYLQQAGYPPEPKASFNGEVMPITRIVARGVGIDRPLSPLMKCVWKRLVSRDGEDDPVSVGDFAETVLEMINLENEEREGRWVA